MLGSYRDLAAKIGAQSKWVKQIEGDRIYRSLRTTDKAIAEEKAHLLEVELQERGTLRPSRIPLKELVTEYLLDARERKSPLTLERDEHVYGKFLETYPGILAGGVTTAKVDRFLKKLLEVGRARRTFNINIYRATLSALFRWAIDRGIVQKNPVAGIRPLPVKRRPPRFFSHEETELLLEEARDTQEGLV